MKLTQSTKEKLKAAFAKDRKITFANDASLPVRTLHVDRVPVRGSVHICTGRVISRTEADRLFEKSFS